MKKIIQSICFLFLSFLLSANFTAAVYPPCPDGVWQLVSKTNTDIHEVGTRIDALSTAVDETTSAIEEALPAIESGLELIDDAVSDLYDSITTLEEYTFSMIETIGSLPIPITSTPYTITQPGFYTLAGVLAGPIIIDADYVTLDMRGYTLYSNMTESYGIFVVSGRHYVTIENGIIDSMSVAGIAVSGNDANKCSNIVLKGVSISNCTMGINYEYCTDSHINGCLFNSNINGIAFNYVDRTNVDNCLVLASSAFGCALYNSRYNTIRNCKIVGTHGVGEAKGIYSEWGELNRFDSCIIEDTLATAVDAFAIGIDLNFALGSSITHCSTNNVQSSERAYGVRVPGNSWQSDEVDNVRAIAWSADGKYIAAVGNGFVNIYEFDPKGTSLVLRLQQGISGIATSVAWTPDGYHLAIGVLDGTIGSIDTYTFNGSSLLYSQSYAFGGGSAVYDVAFSPTASMPYVLAVAGNYSPELRSVAFTDTFRFFPGPAGELDRISTEKFDVFNSFINEMVTLSWKSDGNYLVVGGNFGTEIPDPPDSPIIYRFGHAHVYEVSMTGALSEKASLQIDPQGFFVGSEVFVYSASWQPGPSNFFCLAGRNVIDKTQFRPFAMYEFVNNDINLVGQLSPKVDSEALSITWNQLFNDHGLFLIDGLLLNNIVPFTVRNNKLIFPDALINIDGAELIEWFAPYLAVYNGKNVSVISFGGANSVEYNTVCGTHAAVISYGFEGSSSLNFFGNNRAWGNDVNYNPLICENVTGYSAESYENVSYP